MFNCVFLCSRQKIGRYRDQPIFGTVIHNPPNWRKQNAAERYKAFQEIAHLYGMPMPVEPRRRLTTFRLPGGGRYRTMGIPPVQGSFQHLKVSEIFIKFVQYLFLLH